MAALGERMKGLAGSIRDRFGSPGYSSNLLGESLLDLMRKATAKTLEAPDDVANQQVVTAINEEYRAGTVTAKDVISLLKKRLQQDKPQKQFLAVVLVDRVLAECHDVIGMQQEELLQEVARVMAKPARGDEVAVHRAKTAARELLRRFGRAGQDAFRAAARSAYARPPPPGGLPPGSALYAVEGMTGDVYGGAGPEAASLMDEVERLIESAHANTELLNEMLVNSEATSGPADEFETGLVQELINAVRELRSMFVVLLEQLSAVRESPESEVLMCRALEACDLLDNSMALYSDVQKSGGGSGGVAALGGGAASGSRAPAALPKPAASGAGAGTSAAAVANNNNRDLIALDELAEALTVSAAASPPAQTALPSAVVSSMPMGYMQQQPQQQPYMAAAAPNMMMMAAAAPMGMQYPSVMYMPQATGGGMMQQQQQAQGGGYAMSSPVPAPPAMSPPPAPAVGGLTGSNLSTNNPFASSAAAAPALPAAGSGQAPAVDAEWDMFFADRAAAANRAQPRPSDGFDELVSARSPPK